MQRRPCFSCRGLKTRPGLRLAKHLQHAAPHLEQIAVHRPCAAIGFVAFGIGDHAAIAAAGSRQRTDTLARVLARLQRDAEGRAAGGRFPRWSRSPSSTCRGSVRRRGPGRLRQSQALLRRAMCESCDLLRSRQALRSCRVLVPCGARSPAAPHGLTGERRSLRRSILRVRKGKYPRVALQGMLRAAAPSLKRAAVLMVSV